MTATLSTNCTDLLRQVLEYPFDDGIRLILADALDDDGHSERAEFIRLQIGRSESYAMSEDKVEWKRIIEYESSLFLSNWRGEIDWSNPIHSKEWIPTISVHHTGEVNVRIWRTLRYPDPV